jgi:ADP-ribose pyrophosphatase YjhB (NUDIX family)
MPERSARFCPQCGVALIERERFGKTRPICPNCNHTVFFDPKVAVVAFVVEADQLLLVKRRNEPGKGSWALPAGFVDPEEHPRSAAERETLEETGLIVHAGRMLELLHRPDEGGLADLVIAYEAHVSGGTLGAADDAEAAAWFRRDALPEISMATTLLLVRRWLDGTL